MGSRVSSNPPAEGMLPDADAQLLEQIRSGDAEAGRRFVREHYPALYRYLLYLTGQPELAEDLTQETFLQGWQHLDTFQGRASLRTWLHRIARNAFLQALRRRKTEAPVGAMVEVAAPDATAWMETVELRDVIDRLPLAQREVVLLHHLEGYSSTEIARIVDAPVGTVCYRLARARERLRQALGEDDLTYLNEPLAPMRQWAWLPLDQMHALEARLAMSGEKEDLAMERREFLRQAAAGAAGLVLSESRKEVVDSRLTQKVTLAFKGTALSDLCDHLRTETGVHVTAGASVADEKVTLFCEKTPLREVMRQLSRPFGYTWVRGERSGEYHYELVQDLRSQLLEEELRNRDSNEALLALEKEIERFRPYLTLSPDEALAKAKTAPEAEKPLLETLATVGWGPIQTYFRLSPRQYAALRAGKKLYFSEEPKAGQFPLPEEMPFPLPEELARGVLQCNRGWRILGSDENGFYGSYAGPGETPNPQSVPLTAVPVVRAQLYVELSQSELGQFQLGGASGFFTPITAGKARASLFQGASPYVVGRGPRSTGSESGAVNPKLARDPTLQQRVSIQPRPSCNLPPMPYPGRGGGPEERGELLEPKVTVADALEALHLATGLPIVADFYTRLYKPEAVSVRNRSLFEALNQVTHAMRLRWNKEGSWLQFRSTTYYHDRLKEVPNRLLSRWAAARRQQAGTHEGGGLTLDQIVEIGQLTDDQLDGSEMAEGARECWGLKEWSLLGDRYLRPQVRYLAEFTPDQRQAMLSAAGLPFTKMSLAQQQKFIVFALSGAALQSLDDLAEATLRVDYTQPGWYQWLQPGDLRSRRWAVMVDSSDKGKRVLMPPVRERTPEAALRAARRGFPPVTEAMLNTYRVAPDMAAEQLPPQPDQIAPTELDLVIVYIPGSSLAHPVRWWRPGQQLSGGEGR